MRRILKFPLSLRTEVQTEDEPTWLAVQMQGDTPVAWCEAAPGDAMATVLVVNATGMEAPGPVARYIGTYQTPVGFVGHVYSGPTQRNR